MIQEINEMSDYEKIRDCLLIHNGKNNSITSAQIANILGFDEDDTHAKTRSLIRKTAEIYELPLVADNKGYYLITSQKEFDDYIDNLNSRIKGIEDRKRIITQNYNKLKGE